MLHAIVIMFPTTIKRLTVHVLMLKLSCSTGRTTAECTLMLLITNHWQKQQQQQQQPRMIGYRFLQQTSPAAAPRMRAVKPDVLPIHPGNGAYATEPTMDGRTMQTFFSFSSGFMTLRSDMFFARK